MSDIDTGSGDSGSSGASEVVAPPVTSDPVHTTPTDSTPAPSKPESFRDTMARTWEAKEGGAEAPKPKSGVDRARDDAGRFANQPKVKPTPKPAQPSSTASLAPPEPAQLSKNRADAPPDAAAPVALKAPQSWKPLAREKWASLPPEVQAEAVRVEAETAQALKGAAQYRREAESFRQMVQPYEGMMRARGLDPMQHLSGIVQAESRLANGTPWERAQAGAAIIAQYGLDVDLVSKALTGQQPPAEAQGGQQGAYRDPRVDQLFGMLQQQSQAQRQQSHARVAQSIQDWSKDKEFFEDLREDMAAFHDVAASRGQQLTFDQSYAAALAMPQHEQIRQILEQRKAAQAAAAQVAQVEKQRAASSSIRSQPVTPLRNGAQKTDLRSTIAANFDIAAGNG